METLVALWSLRLALIGGAAVALASYLGGSPLLDAVDRALMAAVAFTFGGGWLMSRLEPPELRLARAQARLSKRRAKPSKAKTTGTKKDVTA